MVESDTELVDVGTSEKVNDTDTEGVDELVALGVREGRPELLVEIDTVETSDTV